MGCEQSSKKEKNPKELVFKSDKSTTSAEVKKRFKAVLLGNSSVGKTSIASYYCTGKVRQNYGPTVGGVYFKKQCKTKSGEDLTLNLWDTAGQQKYKSMAPLYLMCNPRYYRDADVIILVFDLGDHDSFLSIEYWIDELDHKIERDQTIVLVVGNKADIANRQVKPSEITTWLKNYKHFQYLQASAYTGTGVNEIFDQAIQAYLKNQKAAKKCK